MAIFTRLRSVEARYAGDRAIALRRAEDLIQPIFDPTPVSLRQITSEALTAFAAEWQNYPGRHYPSRWLDMASDFRRNEPSRFEVAVWSGKTFCGLGIGKLRPGYCGLNYVEGSPLPKHPLKGKVLAAVLTALTAYAVAMKRQEIRLIEPIFEMVPRYQALGFLLATPARERQYFWKVVS